MNFKLNTRRALDLGLRGDGVRELVGRETEKRGERLRAAIGADKVVTHVGGESRARGTIRRLERLEKEAEDGQLSRTLDP